ncbi:unnamed protein product [Oikopleura dioica]|uniref:Uncharacterized protein n=1 Tax=Oikopleura dioica TaxID=34765 RepID=E4YA11_OIKDI|nr:unnamed protein product [Oikopleura dioica]
MLNNPQIDHFSHDNDTIQTDTILEFADPSTNAKKLSAKLLFYRQPNEGQAVLKNTFFVFRFCYRYRFFCLGDFDFFQQNEELFCSRRVSERNHLPNTSSTFRLKSAIEVGSGENRHIYKTTNERTRRCGAYDS